MLTCTNCGLEKPIELFYRDVSKPTGRSTRCKTCIDLAQKCYRANNVEKLKETSRKYRRENGEKMRATQRDHYSRNRRRVLDASKAWAKQHPQKIKEIKQKYYLRNKDAVVERARLADKKDPAGARERCRRRQSRKLGATPPWLTRDQKREMKQIYAKAREISKITGVPQDVDHVVPLQGKNICGLHVPWNLTIISSVENRKKSNKVL